MLNSHPLRLAVLYALISIVWVTTSDYLLEHLNLNHVIVSELQTFKGIGFVLCITVLLYLYARRGELAQARLIADLQQRTDQLYQAQALAKLGDWQTDQQGRMLWSSQAITLLGRPLLDKALPSEGLPSDDLSDQSPQPTSLTSFLDCLHPDDRAFVAKTFDTLNRQPGQVSVTARLGNSSEALRWLVIEGKHRQDGRVFGTVQDITDHKRAEEALLESQRRYRDLVEYAPVVVFESDLAGRWQFLSPAWERLTGKATANSLGETMPEHFHSQEVQQLRQVLNEFRDRARQTWSGILRLCLKGGDHRWVAVDIHRVGDRLQGILNDIHHEFQADELQRARNAVLDELLGRQSKRSILTGIAQRLENLYPEMRVIIQLADASRQFLRVSAAPSLPDHYLSALENTPITAESGTCGAAVHRNGLVISENIEQDSRWQDLREAAQEAGIRSGWSLPIRDENEEAVGAFGVYYRTPMRPERETISLVTEFARLAALAIRQQRQDAERHEIEQRFRATFEHAAIGITLINLDLYWMRCNQYFCTMVGYTLDELQTRTVLDLTHPADLALGHDKAEALLNGTVDSYELQNRYICKNGQTIWVDLDVTLIRNTRGQPQYYIAVIEDITLRKQQEQSLRQAAALFENSLDGIVILDQQRCVLTANPTFQTLCGQPVKTLRGARMDIPLGGRQDAEFYRTLWRTVQRHGIWEGEMLWRRPNGMSFPCWLVITRIKTQKQRQYVMVLRDTSALKESEARLAHLAHFDPLTNLPNRLLARTRLEHAVKRMQADDQIAVILLDLDHFRTINESYGHPLGDEVLRVVARILKASLRNEDTLARIGGDEFLIIIESLDRPEEIASLVQLIRQRFETPLNLAESDEIFLNVSLGISLYPNDGTTADELIRNADTAMHLAKSQGRDTYRFYTQALTERARRRLSLESRLRMALQRDDFVLHYQPLLEVASGQPFGVEALVRWQDPEHGMISPADFIPLAEETGLIIPLGLWVLEQACRQMRQWLDNGLALNTIAVNLSPRQFAQADLPQRIAQALEHYQLPAHMLELEITEGTLMENVEATLSSLAMLKALGVRIAVDDFGTGYSSLAYLRRFPLDKLKIDQSFMRDIRNDNGEHGNQAIAAAIIALGHGLQLEVLAEGVETQEQLDVMRRLGCQQCQGYLFSRPLPPDALESWYRERHRSL
ncbi:PAS domain S-box-containing protein/diguanylate cyclase (GGDEF)-like protein [Pseudomonas duriflava]|uniref:cyclic-guanylate-specific phosphodiesterase n=1 Tax=Pseudomonas duriflava TaxID=459528 RepID=A0A562QDK7_9PSED|nr:EAL domain-containing protein [Pseudomonas duriflava]TWI54789.1 PAS domain S-box-containing protein/diguanylate cyclase (GGDEF)-like protein [Pseudomonas duriflava]